MKRKRNGFTLVEIVVALSGSAIVCSMVGSMVLFSMNMSAEGIKENQEKQIVDSLVTSFEEDLSSATAIVYSENGDAPTLKKDDNTDLEWHAYSISDGRILRDNSLMYDDAFYQRNAIQLSIKMQSNSALLRVSSTTYSQVAVISLMNKQYTINTSNDEKQIDGDAKLYYSTSKNKQQESSNTPTTPEEPEVTPTPPGESEKPQEPELVNPDKEPTGTIEDYVVSGSNNLGGFQTIIDFSEKNTYIFKGAMVFNKNDGYWYQVINPDWITEDIFSNNSGAVMRRIDPYFSASSAYLKGDVILYEYNGEVNYYRCLNDVLYGWPVPDGDYNSANYWQKLDGKPEGTLQTTIDYDEGGTPMATIADKLEDDAKTSYVGEYDASKTYQIGDMVSITYEAKYGKPYREFYMKMNNTNVKPGEKDGQNRVGWKLYNKLYNSTSAYKKGDVLGIIMNGKVLYFRFLRDCDKAYTRRQIYYNAQYSLFEGGQLVEFLNN